MEIKDLKKLLESTEVEITFKSLKSGRTITEKCSLNKKLIPEGYSFNQSGESDSILCYLTEIKKPLTFKTQMNNVYVYFSGNGINPCDKACIVFKSNKHLIIQLS